MNNSSFQTQTPIRTDRNASEAIRILIVDDHAVLRQGLRSFLATYPDLEVVGEAEDGEDAVQSVQMLAPSVVLMDIAMPRLNGIEATARIKRMFPNVVVLGLSMNVEEGHRRAMTAAGATAVIQKGTIVEQLYDEIIKGVCRRSCTTP
jgi:DNA-binding NarL/FixJ family response regulator